MTFFITLLNEADVIDIRGSTSSIQATFLRLILELWKEILKRVL